MKKILLISLPFLLLTSCTPKDNFYVEKIIDGDTIVLKNKTRIRIFGIDTPESYDAKNHFRPTTGIKHYYATKAKNFMRNAINHKTIKIQYIKLDPYGRSVAKVFYNDHDVAKEILLRGLAKVAYISLKKINPFYTKDKKYYYELISIENKAKLNKVGIWGIKSIKEIYGK